MVSSDTNAGAVDFNDTMEYSELQIWSIAIEQRTKNTFDVYKAGVDDIASFHFSFRHMILQAPDADISKPW